MSENRAKAGEIRGIFEVRSYVFGRILRGNKGKWKIGIRKMGRLFGQTRGFVPTLLATCNFLIIIIFFFFSKDSFG